MVSTVSGTYFRSVGNLKLKIPSSAFRPDFTHLRDIKPVMRVFRTHAIPKVLLCFKLNQTKGVTLLTSRNSNNMHTEKWFSTSAHAHAFAHAFAHANHAHFRSDTSRRPV